jgi:hypothetical protein
MCRADMKTHNHLFRECSYARQLRHYIIAVISPARQQCASYTASTDVDMLIDEKEMYWRQLELTTIFIIWPERCRRIFTGKSHNIPDTVREIFSEHK